MKQRSFTTRAGKAMAFSELGFGTAPLGNLYHAVPDDQARATLEAAWETGCRYYDTAPLYGLGLAETRVNAFLRGRDRDSYILSTKVGRFLEVCPSDQRTGIGKFFDTPSRKEVFDYGYDGVMRSLEQSFERLGVDRIDVLFCHDIDVFTHKSMEARDARIEEFFAGGYQALADLRSAGTISAIGAGVNEWQACEILAKRGIFDLFLLAGRYTLLEQDPLDSFLPLCGEQGIGIILGGPYNSGILATGPVAGAYYNYDPAPQDVLDRVTRIESICSAHGVRLIEAALHFPLGHPSVVSVIPGGAGVKEAQSNARILEMNLPAALWSDLKNDGLVRADAPVPGRRK